MVSALGLRPARWNRAARPLSLPQRVGLLAGGSRRLPARRIRRRHCPWVRQEASRNPGCRFACFGPIFPTAALVTLSWVR